MHANTISHKEGSPAFVQAFAARNLKFLKAIEDTIDSLDTDRRILDAMSEDMQKAEVRLQSLQPIAKIDEEGRISSMLDQCLDTLSRLYAVSKKKHLAACNDAMLTSDDGVEDAYEAYLESLTGFHHVIDDFKNWVQTHDAILEPSTDKTYSSATDLFDALMSHK